MELKVLGKLWHEKKFFWAREGSSDVIELSLPPALAEMSGRSVESESMIERVVLSKWPAVD